LVYGWKRPHANAWDYAGSRAAGVVGAVGFALSILAAGGGAFFGTCNVVGWSIAFGFMPTNIDLPQLIPIALTLGGMAGLAAAIAALVWSFRFYYGAPHPRVDRGQSPGDAPSP